MKRSGLTFEHFFWKWSKIAAQKKVFFADFALVHPPMASVLLSASVERCFVSGNFVKLKSEFELLKLCQRNQNIKPSENKDQGRRSKVIKCNDCDLIFQTATGLKVHNYQVHLIESVAPEDLKCKHCIITCSDLVLMKKHIAQKHRFICKECDSTFKEEYDLTSHSKTPHEQILINK
jgi:hypothetical protein